MGEIIKDIDATLFRAVYMTVSSEAVRYYLNGVYVEPHPNGGAFLVSTDGHMLTVAHDPNATVKRAAILSLSASPASISSKPRDETKNTISALTTPRGGLAKVRVMNNGNTINGAAGMEIEGAFPDWRGVVADIKSSANHISFNGRYLKDVHGAAKLLTGESDAPVSIKATSDASPVLFRCSHPSAENIFWVVMPVRTSQAKLPEFYTSTLPKQKGAA